MRVHFAFVALVACADPVHDAQVAALGAEDPSVPVGELHRPGQPCVLCHDNFAVGGTVYNDDLVTPFAGATVAITDAVGTSPPTTPTTNSAGNFFVRKSDWTPVFPIGSYTNDAGVGVFGIVITGASSSNQAQMLTHIGRDGSCASCHFGSAKSASSPGPVYITKAAP